jgi:hypothetical protein
MKAGNLTHVDNEVFAPSMTSFLKTLPQSKVTIDLEGSQHVAKKREKKKEDVDVRKS